VTFYSYHDGPAWEKIDGLIMTGAGNAHELLPGLPCVSLMRPMPGVTSVVADNFGGARAATEHLLALGHTRIGCLLFTDDVLSQQKLCGYQAALRQAGIAFEPRWLRSLTEPGEKAFDFMRYGAQRMTAWLEEDWRELGLTALLCENDQTAISAINVLREAGLRVPEDVSVVGFDGTEVSEYSHPALTTVEVPLFEIGRRGLEELMRQIEEEKMAAREIVLLAQLKVRASTRRISSE
jgi:DNA-binding LacI/PurR family transcriptional regulator